MSSTQAAGCPALPCPVLRGFDHVELYVGNVRQAAHYYRTVWGFTPIAYQGIDTGSRDRVSVAMRQGSVTLLLTGAINGSSAVAERLRRHGEGVASVAFAVDNVESAYQAAVTQGAVAISDPVSFSDDDGRLAAAEVGSFSGFTHRLIERQAYAGAFWPGFRPLRADSQVLGAMASLDHVAVCVEGGTLDSWIQFYHNVFGFVAGHREDVATEYSGMNSRVMQDVTGVCRFPLVEPAPGKRRSQVEEFLGFHNGAGVQHLAVGTPDIRATVQRLQGNGVEFLGIPDAYYRDLERRVGRLGSELDEIRKLGILVDSDATGQLLQTFARPCQDRPTMFFEVIERRGAKGFGGGNIRALFEAIEREQELRGTV